MSDITKNLNARQRHFCINLASGMTQSDAYINAGYNVDPTIGTASDCASRLMTSNAGVKTYYEYLLKRKEELSLAKITESIMQPHERKVKLSEIARASLVDFQDEQGEPKLTKDTPHHTAAKEHYHRKRVDREGNPIVTKSIKLTDPIEAIRELNRMDGSYAPTRHDIRQVSFKVNFIEKHRETEE